MASSYPSAPAPASRRRRGSIVAPVLLIAVGLLLLLQNLGIVPWNVWGSLWQLWPIVLILLGIDLLLGGRTSGLVAAVLSLLVLLAVLAAAVGIGWWTLGPTGGVVESRSSSQPLDGATRISGHVSFGAGRLSIGGLPGGTDQAGQMTFEGPEWIAIEPVARRINGTLDLRYRLDSSHGRSHSFPWFGGRSGGMSMGVELSPDVPIDLEVETGASDVRIDLSGLRVTGLDLETGASQTWIRFSESAGLTRARIAGGASSIEIEIPDGVAASIRTEGGLNSIEVDESRFPPSGNRGYRSPDFDSAPNRVELTVETGMANVEIR